jgi:glycine cleavage system H protein
LFFFVAIEAIGLILKRREAPAVEVQKVTPFSDIHLPKGLFVDEGHSWAWLTESGELRLGVDEFLSQAVGGIDSIELPAVGSPVSKGEPLATVQCSGREMVLTSPVNGTVVATNDTVKLSPMAIEEDPYGAGWLASVWPVEHTEALKSLKVGEKATAWLENEVQRFVEFLAGRTSPELVGATLPDGARPVIGAALALDDEGWQVFRKDFVGLLTIWLGKNLSIINKK